MNRLTYELYKIKWLNFLYEYLPQIIIFTILFIIIAIWVYIKVKKSEQLKEEILEELKKLNGYR